MNSKREDIYNIRKRKGISILILVVLVLAITIGFALLSSTLNIHGTSTIFNSTWDVRFANLVPTTGSVTPIEPAEISDDGSNIEYEIRLEKPGDFYEFTVDVVNRGTIDAKLKSLPTITGVSEEQDEYVNYTLVHTDGSPIQVGEELKVGDSENFKVRVEFDESIMDDSKLPKTDQTLDLEIQMPYEQK